jgi:aspartyl-tRNA(Asn)/glutamyl-tRNA(Gln) amidotransferase subunit A
VVDDAIVTAPETCIDAAGRTSIAAAARAMRAGTLSPVDLTEACLARIEQCDAHVHAFATLDAAGARRAALEAEREQRAGTWRGPLHGIPFGVKDVIDVAGFPTRANSRQRADAPPASADAAAVAAVRSAGAVIFGKLTTHEFAFGIPEANSLDPAARNPWDTTRFAGGSSSGAAVATACGMVLGALGSDTAGSVRSPAALCGVAGFKPGRSRIDRRGIIPLAASLDAVGIVAPGVEDCAIVYAAIVRAANDPPAIVYSTDNAMPATCDRHGLPHLDTDIGGLRVGVIRHFFRSDAPVSEACGAAIDDALSVLEQLGCTIRDVSLPPLREWHDVGIVNFLTEAYAYHESGLQAQPDQYGFSFREAVLHGKSFRRSDYEHALEQRRMLTAKLDALFESFDILVSAIQPAEAPSLAALSPFDFLRKPSYGLPFNLTDNPALSVPCGAGPAGLPLALQLIGRRDEELTVLRVGHAYEQRMEHPRYAL